jgi:hypothetical protein
MVQRQNYVTALCMIQSLCISCSLYILNTMKFAGHTKTLHCSLFVEYDVIVVNLFVSGFGGLEVACWPLVPKFRGGGFKPGRSRRNFSGEKILSTPSF